MRAIIQWRGGGRRKRSDEEGFPPRKLPLRDFDPAARTAALKKAGRVAAEACNAGAELIGPGVKLLDVAERVEGYMRDHGTIPAFPTNIAIDNVAAHYTPRTDDDLTFQRGGLVKLDLGAHVEGFICDMARTIEVGGTKNWTEMIRASRDACAVGAEMIRPGVDLGAVGAAIGQTIEDAGFKTIENLTGHSLERYLLHAGITVPNCKDRINSEVRAGMVLAIEPFATNGSGRVDGRKPSNIYRIREQKLTLNSESRAVLNYVLDEYGSLPFAERWCAGATKRHRVALQSLLRDGVISSYPILWELDDGMVTQNENTVLVVEGGCVVLTETG